MKIWSRLHGDMQEMASKGSAISLGKVPSKVSSEIPCRVSSDLHEWRNDLGAVSNSQCPSLRQLPNHYAIRAGRNLPDKEFRYLRTVIITAAVYRGFSSKRSLAANLSL